MTSKWSLLIIRASAALSDSLCGPLEEGVSAETLVQLHNILWNFSSIWTVIFAGMDATWMHQSALSSHVTDHVMGWGIERGLRSRAVRMENKVLLAHSVSACPLLAGSSREKPLPIHANEGENGKMNLEIKQFTPFYPLPLFSLK